MKKSTSPQDALKYSSRSIGTLFRPRRCRVFGRPDAGGHRKPRPPCRAVWRRRDERGLRCRARPVVDENPAKISRGGRKTRDLDDAVLTLAVEDDSLRLMVTGTDRGGIAQDDIRDRVESAGGSLAITSSRGPPAVSAQLPNKTSASRSGPNDAFTK